MDGKVLPFTRVAATILLIIGGTLTIEHHIKKLCLEQTREEILANKNHELIRENARLHKALFDATVMKSQKKEE